MINAAYQKKKKHKRSLIASFVKVFSNLSINFSSYSINYVNMHYEIKNVVHLIVCRYNSFCIVQSKAERRIRHTTTNKPYAIHIRSSVAIFA